MLGWAERHGRMVPDWGLDGSLGRSLIRLLNRSQVAAEGTVVADRRTQHRIAAAGFGTAAAVGVAADSPHLAGRVGCRRMAGTGGPGDTAGTAGRWTHCTTEPGCTVAVDSLLAVASGRIPEVREFHGFHTVEAARRMGAAAVVAVVVVGSNPGSSRSCRRRRSLLEVDIGSWFRCAITLPLLLRYLGVRMDWRRGEMKKTYQTREIGLLLLQ